MRLKTIEKRLNGHYGIRAWKARGSAIDVLISTILSQRTKDENTHLATEQLFSKFATPKELASIKPELIYGLIRPAGFYKQKAEKIIQTSKIVHEKYGSHVPDDMEELLTLPGVGRKTASCVLAYGFGKPAIAVDTHVHRISNLLGLVQTATPDDTEEALMFQVEDEGEGIAPQHIPRLTERFYRVDVGRSRERGGTGLGLAIVKHVLTRHGGQLDIESVVGQGSTFTCRFPKRG